MLDMTDQEIYSIYRKSAHPTKQIRILAELNNCSQEAIRQSLRRYEDSIMKKDCDYKRALEKCNSTKIKGDVLQMKLRNPEPISGIKPTTTSDKSIRWRKRTKISHDYDADWNNWIDSMRMHLEMAKECERQLIRLEKQYGSHRRKENQHD